MEYGLRFAAMGKKEKKSIEDYKPEVLLEKARANHIYLNAFSCVNPTEEFVRGIGENILDMLANTDMSDGLGCSPMIILTINKS